MNLELVTGKIVRPEKEQEDEVGKPISTIRLRELYPADEYVQFWTFVNYLYNVDWYKFCVSKQQLKFAIDYEMRFFEIDKVKNKEMPEIIYLGRNKAPNTTEIYNQVAAESWGFAVLVLTSEKLSRFNENKII